MWRKNCKHCWNINKGHRGYFLCSPRIARHFGTANAKKEHWAYVVWIGLLRYWKTAAKDRSFTLLIFTTEFKEVSYIELCWRSEIYCTASSVKSRCSTFWFDVSVYQTNSSGVQCLFEQILCCRLLLWSIAISVLSAVFSRHTKKSS